MAKGKIVIAAHKKYEMPTDKIYLPVQAGREIADRKGRRPLPYQPDNTGENISEKNPSYCELTVLYWAWKNLDCEYLGLAHYRRHFTVKSRAFRVSHTPMECVLTEKEFRKLTRRYQIIVPEKRNYYIETLYSHYAHTHYREHLDITREILAEKYPEYLPAFDKVMKQRAGYMFNMFIMKRELSDAYCEWLFDILGELENRMAGKEYTDGRKHQEYKNCPKGRENRNCMKDRKKSADCSGGSDSEAFIAYQGRLYGRVSEILFNVWLADRPEEIKEIGYLPLEKEHWEKKIPAFIGAKLGRKYRESF